MSYDPGILPAFASDVAAEAGQVGLTKREYFAAMAMQGLIKFYEDANIHPTEMAQSILRYVDALLIELNK